MRFSRHIPALFPLFLMAANTALAADQNGYTAQYECRSGGQYCNVDVVALGSRSCDQLVTPSAPWSSINWSNNTICLGAGDHTWKGILTIPASSSGSSSNRKVLRYDDSNDQNAEPWNQANADQAKLSKIVVAGSYWLIHRLTFPSVDQDLGQRIQIIGGVNNVIVNRVLVEGSGGGYANTYRGIVVECCNSQRITVQNSLVRDNWNRVGAEPHGITPIDGTDIHIVNNEVRNWSAHNIQIGRNEGPTMGGFVVENNDLYLTSEWHTRGGTMARAKGLLHIKASGTASNPGKLLHNRFWGGRITDLGACCLVGDTVTGIGIIPPQGYSYILIQNNIISDQQKGLVWSAGSSNHQSVVGNIWHKMRVYDRVSFPYSHAIELRATTSTEIYLNTFIDNEQYGLSFSSGLGDTDIRCNAFISAGNRQGGTPDQGTQVDGNAFYDTPSWGFNGSTPNVEQSIMTRSNGTNYSIGHILRVGPADSCTNSTDSTCFLYRALNAGRTADTAPNYCTSLGCTMTDGEVTLQAVRGPYTVFRKLKSGPESYTIPYVRVHASAAESYRCPANFASRRGIGVSDD